MGREFQTTAQETVSSLWCQEPLMLAEWQVSGCRTISKEAKEETSTQSSTRYGDADTCWANTLTWPTVPLLTLSHCCLRVPQWLYPVVCSCFRLMGSVCPTVLLTHYTAAGQVRCCAAYDHEKSFVSMQQWKLKPTDALQFMHTHTVVNKCCISRWKMSKVFKQLKWPCRATGWSQSIMSTGP